MKYLSVIPIMALWFAQLAQAQDEDGYERAQWATDGPVVVSTSGEVLGTLSTVETNTHSIFNETIYVQIPYTDRCEACIGSLNDNFSTVGPKIYDSQSSELKDKIGEVIGAPLQENP